MTKIKFKRPASESNAPAANVDTLEYGEPGFDPLSGLLYLGLDNSSSMKFVKEGADTNYLPSSGNLVFNESGMFRSSFVFELRPKLERKALF